MYGKPAPEENGTAQIEKGSRDTEGNGQGGQGQEGKVRKKVRWGKKAVATEKVGLCMKKLHVGGEKGATM